MHLINSFLFVVGVLLSFATHSAVLVNEDWEDGNKDGWLSLGNPVSYLESSTITLGNYSLENNGDQNFHSGVVWSSPFLLESNLHLQVSSIAAAGNCQNRPFCINVMGLRVDNDLQSQLVFGSIHDSGRGGDRPGIFFHGTSVRLPVITDSWIEFDMYTNPNGSVSYYLNGEFAAQTEAGFLTYNGSTVYLSLDGRSFRSNTRMMMDNILLETNATVVPAPSAAVLFITSISLMFGIIKSARSYKLARI